MWPLSQTQGEVEHVPPSCSFSRLIQSIRVDKFGIELDHAGDSFTFCHFPFDPELNMNKEGSLFILRDAGWSAHEFMSSSLTRFFKS